jgi:CBS domain-containing protein
MRPPPAALTPEIDGATNSAHLHPDHTLGFALERMGETKLKVLPVVSRANVHQVLGMVRLEDVLEAYGVGRPESTEAYNE